MMWVSRGICAGSSCWCCTGWCCCSMAVAGQHSLVGSTAWVMCMHACSHGAAEATLTSLVHNKVIASRPLQLYGHTQATETSS